MYDPIKSDSDETTAYTTTAIFVQCLSQYILRQILGSVKDIKEQIINHTKKFL